MCRRPESIVWMILTTGSREEELRRAIDSLSPHPVVVLANGVSEVVVPDGEHVTTLKSLTNLGVPGGRHALTAQVDAELIAFLDDDATAEPGITSQILGAFEQDPGLGAVALRIVDEHGVTARRHVPRLGGRQAERSGEVAFFLGGACALRKQAYDDAGGYWAELFYGHEEVELSWRLIDRGWRIHYLASARVFHPRTDIGRHADGWQMTGRNRVMVARRTLPWPVAVVHVSAWLVLGLLRAPGREQRRAYAQGWWSGWRRPVDHDPIAWRTVWRLTRLRRPPVL